MLVSGVFEKILSKFLVSEDLSILHLMESILMQSKILINSNLQSTKKIELKKP